MEKLAQFAERHKIIVFADEIYDRVLYDGNTHRPFASYTDAIPIVTLNGISKSSFAAGYRAAWMVLTGDWSMATSYMEGIDMLSNMRLCSNVPAQYAIEAALSSNACIAHETGPQGRLTVQRDICFRDLNAIPGVSCTKPKGALYCFPRFDAKKFRIEDDKAFVRDFLREKKVLLVQGTGFNWPENNHARIVFLPQAEILSDAIVRLRDFLAEKA
jgi:alanine-synthesizing transaminase